MKAALFSEHGGPEVVRLAEVPSPEPGPGEVRIRVRASSLNHLDLWVRRGLTSGAPMPHIGGADVTGEVESVGPGAEGVPLGARVVVDPVLGWEWTEGAWPVSGLPSPRFGIIGEHTNGGHAELVTVPAANLLQLPTDVSFETAAAAALVFVTAWRGLISRGRLRPGERVLVTGASGGVSTAAIQIAATLGAEVFAVTSGPEKSERVRALGAHVVLDRLTRPLGELLREATRGRRLDLAFDSVGGSAWPDIVKALRPGGRLVVYGATVGPEVGLDLRHIFWKQLSVLGTSAGSPTEFREVMRMVFSGAFTPVIDRVLPLEEVGEGHRLLEEGRVFGKIVVRP